VGVKIFACGDIVSTDAKDFLDDNIRKVVENADIAICNFEASIKTDGAHPIKKAGPHLVQAPEMIPQLRKYGFDYVSLANNHIYDYGDIAMAHTMSMLEDHGLQYVGCGRDFAQTYQPKVVETNGVKIGLIAGCENEFGCLDEDRGRSGYAWILHRSLEDCVRELKKNVDIVIVLAHAGVENIDFPIKEWREQYRRFCDIGADVVIGHHPHVPQGYEKYGESMIFYSLGNFYFDVDGFEKKSDDSYSVILDIEKDGLKDFDIIFHKKRNGQLCIVKEDEVVYDMDHLNSLLGAEYERLNDTTSLCLFEKYYRGYYEEAMNGMLQKVTFIQGITNIARKTFFPTKSIVERNLLLLHNIKIDSHRFVVQRALYLLTQKDE
jgi:poly-gamma-glutamate synthesis protein (capsule biosynthesis protein)